MPFQYNLFDTPLPPPPVLAAPVPPPAPVAAAPAPVLPVALAAPPRPRADPAVVAAILARRAAPVAAPAPAPASRRRRPAPVVEPAVDFDAEPEFDADAGDECPVSVLAGAGLAAAARVARCGALAD